MVKILIFLIKIWVDGLVHFDFLLRHFLADQKGWIEVDQWIKNLDLIYKKMI